MSTEKNVFKSFKQRLVSLDSRNSSYFLSRLIPKKHIDLVKFSEILKTDEDIVQNINQHSKLLLKRPQLKEYEIIKELNKYIDLKDDIEFNELFNFKKEDINQYVLLIKNAVSDLEKEKFINDLKIKLDLENYKYIKQFESLNNKNRSIQRELGKNNLYLGFPFIEGKFQSDKDFRAPLILHRVEIKLDTEKVEIKILKEGRIINPIFLLSYFSENGKDYKRFDLEIPDNDDDFVNYAISVLEDNNIKVKVSNLLYEKIESITKKDYKTKYFNEINAFSIKNYIVLGLFPLSNRNIYDDLDTLEKNENKIPESLDSFLFQGQTFEISDKEEVLKESKIKYISPIDWSQRVVIKKALESNIVIEGPPGTGKSQTIVNIIVNLLLQNKNVLLVSEKVAAIEVVHNRLGNLKDFSLILEDHIKNKEVFFEQIKKAEIIRTSETFSSQLSKQNDQNIDRHFEVLKEINNPNYNNGMSFETILKYTHMTLDLNLTDFQKDSISEFISSLKKTSLNMDERLDNLITKENLRKLNQFFINEELTIFKQSTNTEIDFFISMISSIDMYNFVQFNHYLNRTGKTLIKNINLEILSHNERIIVSTYGEFEKYIHLLFEKLEKYKEDFLQIKFDIYKDFIFDEKKLDLVLSWNKLSDMKRKYQIRKISRLDHSKLKLLFKNKLTNDELLLYDFLSNYHSSLDFEFLGKINKNFTKTDLIIAFSFYSNGLNSLEELYNVVLKSDLFKFKDLNFEKIFNQFKLDYKDIDLDVFKQFQTMSKTEVNFIRAFKEINVDKENFKDLLIKLSLDNSVMDQAREIEKYIINYDENNSKVLEAFNDKYKDSENLVYDHVHKHIIRKLQSSKTIQQEYFQMINQSDSKRRKTVKSIFSRYSNAILTSFPIILMTPDTVSAVFPLNPGLFDYVIFDESSQLFIERAVPSIYRSKRVVVAGDSKQLKPSSIFTTRYTENDEIDEDLNISNEELEVLDKESLLEMSKVKYAKKMLKFHYRSDYKELIEFSSRAFYDNQLIFASKNNLEKESNAIEVIDVENGYWTSENNNPIEAERVVNLVKEILSKRKNNETLGIITFNIKQKELIQDLLEDSEDEFIQSEMNRENSENNSDESLFVKNIENVQGDERDIIIFSIAYAKNSEGRIKAQFGLLSQTGGENRLNVAITRAKKKIYIIKSIKANDLNVNQSNIGPLRFKQYLQFCEYVHNKKHELKENVLNSLNDFKKVENSKYKDFDSPFEEEVYDLLEAKIPKNYQLATQVDQAGYRIDIAIYDKLKNEFILGIECDGYQWHSKPEDIERDYYRQMYLESRGWKIQRILSTNWWINKEFEVEKIINILKATQT